MLTYFKPPCLRLYGNKAEAWLQHSISVLDAQASISRCRIDFQMLHPSFAFRQSFGVRKPCLRLDSNKAEAWLQHSISVLDTQASFPRCRIGFQMPLLVTPSASLRSHSATIQTSIFDKALAISCNELVIIP